VTLHATLGTALGGLLGLAAAVLGTALRTRGAASPFATPSDPLPSVAFARAAGGVLLATGLGTVAVAGAALAGALGGAAGPLLGALLVAALAGLAVVARLTEPAD
jgi:hypothetical protein